MKPESILAGHKAALAELIEFYEWADIAIGVIIHDFEGRQGYKPPFTVAERQRMKLAIQQAKEVILW